MSEPVYKSEPLRIAEITAERITEAITHYTVKLGKSILHLGPQWLHFDGKYRIIIEEVNDQ